MKKLPVKAISIPLKEARRLWLHRQMLLGPAKDTMSIIDQLGYVQIDTISVIARAHHHVIWSRNPKYQPKNLDKLLAKRQVFEYWTHAASYLPIDAYRFSWPLKEDFRKRMASRSPLPPRLLKDVMKRIEHEGPLKSKDFQDSPKKGSGWWDWKPAKTALERLFLIGELEISCRDGFQKVYDLPSRVIPEHVDRSPPSQEEFISYLIDRTLRQHGLATAKEIAYLCPASITKQVIAQLNHRMEAQEIIPVKIESIEDTYFCFPGALEQSQRLTRQIKILSPFDNLTIQRKKLKTFFNFDYQIECYLPAAKRKYGYFSLPVLGGDQFIGRVDLKADRKEKTLRVQSLHGEKGVAKAKLVTQLQKPLKQFAIFNHCERVSFQSNC